MTIYQDQLAAILTDARANAEAVPECRRRWVTDIREDGRAWIDTPDVDGHTFSLHGFPTEAQHIARMDPATTLLLLDAVETLRAENELWKRAEEAQTDLVRAMFDALGGDPVRDTADVLAASVRARAEAAEAEAADLRTRVANVRALADQFDGTVGFRGAATAVRVAIGDMTLDGPQDGTRAAQQVANLAGLTVADVRDVGGVPQDGGDAR